MEETQSQLRKAGRPEIEISPEHLESLASLHCTQEEIAGFFGIHQSTLEKRLRSRKRYDTRYGDRTLREILEIGKAQGKVSLRREQLRLIKQGSAAMAIFLGKQILGQKDRHELAGDPENPLVTLSAVDALLEQARADRDRRRAEVAGAEPEE